MTATETPVDEETPLLQQQPKKKTPLPWSQYSLVLLLQLGEPMTSQVIYPFAPQLIRDLGITGGDETKVGYYVGIMQSLFFFTQAWTVLHWSRLSDRVGRKPVILIGLFGLSMSMYCFGLSTTFWGLVMSRALNGALNGNIGVIKSMMAELTDSTNIAQAYAYMPIAWSTGGTLGPIIGGSLSHPAERFPSLFGNSEFLKKYPYFLPCAVPATYTVCAWLITYIFLKETVQRPTSFRSLIFGPDKKLKLEQNQVATVDDSDDKPLPLRSLLVFRVIIAASNYAFLSLVDIAFRAIQPVFLSTPIEMGGLGLPPSTIGNILSVYGVLNGFIQIFFFAKMHDRWGSKKVFTAGIAACIPMFLLFPIINYLARSQGLTPLVWGFVSLQVGLAMMPSLSFSSIFIFITAASPNKASLGATNGLCQVAVSVMRAFGPAAANSLFSLSMAYNLLGGYLVYYILVVIVGIALFVASILPSSV
ncbi:hypothetical protein AGABI1DRAFT_114886 [Agaricus bisporus var. burnettii JB137-S8]|uniref:Major facilitator superfamily (MFS) profile domain-containing protein n=2 Tax=Agaricus bisporus var. burnettii TaxID=192524 RepID=K5VUB5_AGABU|nr:uncharacterized protein AGABI1DRAFT_114886 [Agaricus bisporus var. burnettii JB137-S8]EKM78054.1 hypothetical protein AGABI1DRAFT_114886 [Agaricus bisporus var. burnettii JB137-S8]KAF7773542.1 hypothetical protein Agabi119p4_5709 [Agaricus bisporus var. burnettii]